MDSSDAKTVIRKTKKSTFRGDLLTGLYDLVTRAKIYSSDTETVIKNEIADALHWFAEMAKDPDTAPESITKAISEVPSGSVKSFVLVGTGNLVEQYGGMESDLATKLAMIQNLEETFRLRDGPGALDYGEGLEQKKETETKALGSDGVAGSSSTTKHPSG